ncbi:MAG: hypothetical protein NT015_07860 [Alphaproteobacteria bacterium]|nr:hypothetical protein [Alphaproteobacteria bacterium]
MLNVEVSLLHTDRAGVDWIQGAHREEIVSIVVEHCIRLVAQRVAGSIQDISHSNFCSNGMTVYISIATDRRRQAPPDIDVLERSLESSLQSYLGWRQAAVSVQLEMSRPSAPRPLI